MDVDDILQDVWLTVLRQLDKLRNPKAFSAWIYQVARNKVYRELKSHREFSPLTDDLAAPLEDPDEDSLSPDTASAVHQCLDRLRPEHREVLLLRFLEGMSYEDIAQVVGCGLGTVRSRIHYAKRTLAQEIRGRFDGK